MLVYTFWLADYQYVCVCVTPRGPASYSAGVGGVMMCLCSWALAHPRSRHLYNSIRLAGKVGANPSQNTGKASRRERERRCGL